MIEGSAPTIDCPKCGGVAHYNFERGGYRCQTCFEARQARATQGQAPRPIQVRAQAQPRGQAQPVPSPPPITAAVKPIISEGPELPLAELEKRLGEAVPGSPEVILTSCQGCGAQVEVPSTSSLGECLFCDRKVQTGKAMPSTTAGKAVVVPFSVEMPEALKLIREHLDKLWLRPGKVRKLTTAEHVRKVYVPFWAYDVDIKTSWNASRKEYQEPGCLASLFGSAGRYVSVPISGDRVYRADDWLACASIGIEAPLVRELEPFSTSLREAGGVPPSEIPVERCTIGPTTAWNQAQHSLRRYEYQQVRQSLAQESDSFIVALAGRVRMGEPVGKAVWLPLYVLSVRTWRGYAQVVVNGETGKVASRIPYSLVKGTTTAVACAGLVVATAGTIVPVVIAAWAWVAISKAQRTGAEATFMAEK